MAETNNKKCVYRLWGCEHSPVLIFFWGPWPRTVRRAKTGPSGKGKPVNSVWKQENWTLESWCESVRMFGSNTMFLAKHWWVFVSYMNCYISVVCVSLGIIRSFVFAFEVVVRTPITYCIFKFGITPWSTSWYDLIPLGSTPPFFSTPLLYELLLTSQSSILTPSVV